MLIEMQNISKSYHVFRRNSGIKETVSSFFKRNYENVQALSDISFSVGEGEIIGYIGPNGAGKSSTIKIMSGILIPDSGNCLIDGRIPWENRIDHVKNIGVVFGQRSQLWWDIPVIDSFMLFKDIYKISDSKFKKNLSELSELLNLETLLKTPVRQLSLGQRMRCEFAASLLHSPKVLFLDEPTIGLDATSKIAVRNFIKSINKFSNTTVILTTHDMQDIEALAKRIILIGKGKLLMDGDISYLKKRFASDKKILVDYKNGSFNECKGLIITSDSPNRIIVNVDTNILSIADAVHNLCENAEVNDISIIEPSAEEIVSSLYKEYNL